MYLLNRGYHSKIDDGINPNGIILSASGLVAPQIERRTLPNSDIILFDPQLYFPQSMIDNCTKIYSNLSTYPWFNDNPPKYDSTAVSISEFKKDIVINKGHHNISYPTSQKEIKKRIEQCLDFQVSIGSSYLILPVPLVVDPDDQYDYQLKWINSGLSLTSNYDTPILVTIALSDDVLVHKKFEKNQLLQTIIDNLTALENIDGYYVVITRSTNNNHILEKSIVHTILELSYILGHEMDKKVFLNFIDNLGFLGLAVGAYAFGSGYRNKEKRFDFNDFIDRDSGGPALPHFYSHNLIGDFFPDRDLSKLNSIRLLRYIKHDNTKYSKSLIACLEANEDVAELSDWRETPNNVSTATKHRCELMIKRSNALSKMSFNEKIETVLTWLQNADSNISYLNSRLINEPLSEDCKHIPVWRNCFEEFIDKHELL